MKKIHQMLPEVCHVLEFILAMAVLAGFFLAAWHIFVTKGLFGELFAGHVEFSEFLEEILALVIGIEFLEMLCKPDSANVLEILIFLVARHMIVAHPTPLENFISVVAICLLCVVRRLLAVQKVHQKEEEEHHHHEEEIHHLEEEKLRLFIESQKEKMKATVKGE